MRAKREMMRGRIALLGLLVFSPIAAIGQQIDESVTGTVAVEFVAPRTWCNVDGNVGTGESTSLSLNFGVVVRDDPCTDDGSVDVTANPASGSITSAADACVVASGGMMENASIIQGNSNSITGTIEFPTALETEDGKHALIFNSGSWAYATVSSGPWTTIGGSWSVFPGGSNQRSTYYFRAGGTVAIPEVTSDAEYTTYTGTPPTITFSCS